MKIHVLGTGHADVVDNFNTCFVIDNNGKMLLVDGGGGNRLFAQLKKININYLDLQNAFISHNHTDHLLGIIYLTREALTHFAMGYKTTPLNIYGSKICLSAIEEITKICVGEKLWDKYIDKMLFLKEIKDGDKKKIIDLKFEFFDTLATDIPQMGFYLKDKNFVFAGDVPLNEKYFKRFSNVDYLCLEAFCSEREKGGKELPLLKHYSVLKAAEIGQKLNVKNLILWHTDEGLGKKRKSVYTKEAKTIFDGSVIVPNDLETIEI